MQGKTKKLNYLSHQMKNTYFILVGLIGLLGLIAQPTMASQNSAEIFNNIKVEANTGNNSGATEQNGKSSIEVEINQSINNEILPAIKISTSSENGESRAIQFHTENASGSTRIETGINATINQNNLQKKQSATSSADEKKQTKLQLQSKERSLQLLISSFSRSLNIFKAKFYNYVSKFFK